MTQTTQRGPLHYLVFFHFTSFLWGLQTLQSATLCTLYDFLVVLDDPGSVSNKPELRGEALQAIHFEWGLLSSATRSSQWQFTWSHSLLFLECYARRRRVNHICGHSIVCFYQNLVLINCLRMLPVLKHKNVTVIHTLLYFMNSVMFLTGGYFMSCLCEFVGKTSQTDPQILYLLCFSFI